MYISIADVRKIGLSLANGTMTAKQINEFLKDTAPIDTTPQDVVNEPVTNNEPIQLPAALPVVEAEPVAEIKPADEEQFSKRKLHARIKAHIKAQPQVIVDEPAEPELDDEVDDPEDVIEGDLPEPVIVTPTPGRKFTLKLGAPIVTDPDAE
jgi:hypothetical protein